MLTEFPLESPYPSEVNTDSMISRPPGSPDDDVTTLDTEDESSFLSNIDSIHNGKEILSRFDEIRQYIVGLGVSSPNSFRDSRSPQYKALHWISEVDPLQRAVPANASGSFQLVQRYSLAVLFYAHDGARWYSSAAFLQGEKLECDWSEHVDGYDFPLGVGCNEKEEVISLFLSKYINYLRHQLIESNSNILLRS